MRLKLTDQAKKSIENKEKLGFSNAECRMTRTREFEYY